MKNVASLATFRLPYPSSPSMEPMTTDQKCTEIICTEKLILGMTNAAYIGLKIATDLDCDREMLPPLPLIPLEFSPKHDGKKVASLGGLGIDHLEVSTL